MKYEKEMIPLLNEYLVNDMGYLSVLNEFDSGYGIADVVAIKNMENDFIYPFYNLIDIYLIKYIPLDVWISFDEIKMKSHYSDKHLKYNILKRFIDSDYVIKERDLYKRIKNIPKPKTKIIAIEAKLKKWKDAFNQVLRYKKYADYCYVALLDTTIKNVDINIFNSNNIGILSVSNKEIKQYIKPYINQEKDEIYTLYANSIFFNA